MTEVMTELEELRLSTEIRNLESIDISTAAALVNARVIPDFIGKRVRAVVQVMGSHSNSAVTAKFIDGSQQTLTLTGKIPQVPPMNYVEVYGIAQTISSISSERCYDIGDEEFDVEEYNLLVEEANGKFKSAIL